MKNRIFGISILIVIYLGFDYQLYYYGLGQGWIAPKIPKDYTILFSGSDLGNQGVILKENVIGGVYLVAKNRNVYLDQDNNIFIKSFLGYYFNKENIIIEITDNTKTKRYVKIMSKRESLEYISYFFNEIDEKFIENYRYIDLKYSLKYFKTLKFIKNSIFITIVIFILLLLKKII